MWRLHDGAADLAGVRHVVPRLAVLRRTAFVCQRMGRPAKRFEHYVSLLVAARLLDLRQVAFVRVEVAERAAAARRVERLQAVVVCRKALE